MKPGFPTAEGPLRLATQSASAAAELGKLWRTEKPPALQAFLADWMTAHPESTIETRELSELASIDLRERRRRGERPQAEDYLARFHQLSSDEELALDVIYTEFLIRESLGESPAPLEYQQRFPQYAETLLDQIKFHLALGIDGARRAVDQDTHSTPSAARQTAVTGERLPAHLTHFIPGYEILSELGRGGMGIVYTARQLSLNRLVALKMLRAGDCGSPALSARFRAEAEAVARLHHPQIVQIYDYSEHDGLPYLALELVEGGSLAGKLDGTPWPSREAVELIVTLSRAVQFAHEQGIVHRDLKPANVLVAAHDRDRSAGSMRVKISDFGLAKVFRENADSQTQTGTVLGTPSYMAPEQARGRPHLIGPAADIYALGAILYELLTGQPPFLAATAMETLNQLLTSDPISPARLAPRLPRDLITIVSKCLQKEPQQRYISASELADDLDRFLRDRPIHARRTSIFEHGWRWCRRNPVLASLAGSVAMLLIALAAVSLTYSVRLSRQLTKTQWAEREEGASRRTAEIRLWDSYLAEINAGYGSHKIGQRAVSIGTVDQANELLGSIGRTPERVLKLRNATIAALARPDLRQVRIVAKTLGIASVDLSVAADRYAAVSANELTVHRLSTDEVLYRISIDEPGSDVAISSDGQFVATTSESGATLWQCEGRRQKQIWQTSGANYVTFSPDSRQFAVSDAAGMRLIDLQSIQTVRHLGTGQAQSRFAFHTASRRIAVCTPQGLQIIDWDTGDLIVKLLGERLPAGGVGVAWHPNGELLAVGGLNDGVELWAVAAKRLRATYPHRGPITSLYFGCSGSLLLTSNPWTTELRFWNVGTGQEVLRDPTFGEFATDSSAHDGTYLLRAETDGVTLCRLQPGLATNPFTPAANDSLGDVYGIAVSPNGRFLAVGRQRGFELWDLVTLRRLSHASSLFCGPAFDCRGNLFIACRGGLYRWPVHESAGSVGLKATASRTVCFGPPEKLSGPLSDVLLDLSADGNLLVVHARSGWQLLRSETPGEAINLEVNSDLRGVSVAPDGRSVALTTWDEGGAMIFDSKTGKCVRELPAGRTGKPLYSPNGEWLATTPNGVCVWRVDDWKLTTQIHARGTTPSALGFAFSSDSRVLAVGQPNGVTRLVDPATGKDWAELRRPDLTDSLFMAFAPDRSRLIEVPAGDRGAPRIWNLDLIRKELSRRGLDWPADVLRVSPENEISPASTHVVVTLDEGNLPSIRAD